MRARYVPFCTMRTDAVHKARQCVHASPLACSYFDIGAEADLHSSCFELQRALLEQYLEDGRRAAHVLSKEEVWSLRPAGLASAREQRENNTAPKWCVSELTEQQQQDVLVQAVSYKEAGAYCRASNAQRRGGDGIYEQVSAGAFRMLCACAQGCYQTCTARPCAQPSTSSVWCTSHC